MVFEEIHLLTGTIIIRGRMFPEGRERVTNYRFRTPYIVTLYKYYEDIFLIGTM